MAGFLTTLSLIGSCGQLFWSMDPEHKRPLGWMATLAHFLCCFGSREWMGRCWWSCLDRGFWQAGKLLSSSILRNSASSFLPASFFYEWRKACTWKLLKRRLTHSPDIRTTLKGFVCWHILHLSCARSQLPRWLVNKLGFTSFPRSNFDLQKASNS